MREEVSMGGMWPGIYNLTEKSVSARGQVWALSSCSSPGSLAPAWVESHLPTSARERLVFIPQKTRGSVLPASSPGALIASSLSLCVLPTQPSSRLPTPLHPGGTPSAGSARLFHVCARQRQGQEGRTPPGGRPEGKEPT